MNQHTLPTPPVHKETQFLFDLVSAKSLSGDESNAAKVFVRGANALGFDTHIDQVGNAIAHRGDSPQQAVVHIVLLGHIDTVPGDIPVRIENGILHGRGSVDAKGPLAAMLFAAVRTDLPDGVGLSVVGAVGEETASSIGARHLVDQWRPDACIIGEPSGFDGVTLGYKGRLLANAIATCPNTHSAGKDPSASDELFAWWTTVQSKVDTFNIVPTRTFDKIQSCIHHMSSSCDGLNQHAVLNVGFRLPPTMDPKTLMDILESQCNTHINVQFEGAEHASATTRNDPVVRAISSAIRSTGNQPRPKLKTGTADLNVVAPIWDCPMAAYGPGDSSLDHTPTEHLNLNEYHQSINILDIAIRSLACELSAANPSESR